MSNDNLKISIITICLNCDQYIEKTIQSVIAQIYPNIEYIIIDGASKDNTLKIIDKYRKNISHITSEKDNGIYDAMNKGVTAATGDIIYFLNGGDYFYSETSIHDIVDEFRENDFYDILFGDIIRYTDTFSKLQSCDIKRFVDIVAKGICHQAIFARHNLFKEWGV